jgi:hypothetical protein
MTICCMFSCWKHHASSLKEKWGPSPCCALVGEEICRCGMSGRIILHLHKKHMWNCQLSCSKHDILWYLKSYHIYIIIFNDIYEAVTSLILMRSYDVFQKSRDIVSVALHDCTPENLHLPLQTITHTNGFLEDFTFENSQFGSLADRTSRSKRL